MTYLLKGLAFWYSCRKKVCMFFARHAKGGKDLKTQKAGPDHQCKKMSYLFNGLAFWAVKTNYLTIKEIILPREIK